MEWEGFMENGIGGMSYRERNRGNELCRTGVGSIRIGSTQRFSRVYRSDSRLRNEDDADSPGPEDEIEVEVVPERNEGEDDPDVPVLRSRTT